MDAVVAMMTTADDMLKTVSADTVFWFAIMFMWVCNFLLGRRISGDQIAMQWDSTGTPTWHAPKELALLVFVVFAFAVRFMIYRPTNLLSPDGVDRGTEIILDIAMVFSTAVIVGVHLLILLVAVITDRKKSKARDRI